MNNRPAVYTAIYGGADRLLDPAPQDMDVDWYCFTDDRTITSGTWRVVYEEPRYEDPRLAAKWPKLLPHQVLSDHRWTVWVDANLQIDSPVFVREALGYARNGIAVFRHPFRYCIYHEAYACMRREDCRRLPVVDQVQHYRSQGHPARGGLYACGVIVRDSATLLDDVGAAWLEECVRWSTRDQLSFPVVLARFGITPSVFPFHIGRSAGWLSIARYFGMTPGTFPIYLLNDAEARRYCASLWFPPLSTFPLSYRRGMLGLPKLDWAQNPWLDVRPHSHS